MVIGKTRREDLVQLERFVKQERVAGSIANQFYYYLRTAYPLEFIYLARNHKKSSVGYLHFIEEAKQNINRAYKIFRGYLMAPPTSEQQSKEFEYVVNKLTLLLEKQSKEN